MRRICIISASLWACLTFSFLAIVAAVAAQDSQKTPMEWLTKAANASDIQVAGMPPFKMRAKVRILGDKNQQYEGTFELLWNSPTQWREQAGAEVGAIPSDVAGTERYLEIVSRRLTHAIAKHEFSNARYYDQQERKARALLAELRAEPS
jgi:hypothetical protein